ncbi:MAG: LOG family protein [Candidatus Peribacteraceae bacterium]|nr:LOG family protein [Candidatus Peribacteraceae bacterium]MDD5739304.1 LOG family protein [Candidatus Peribacteraceae bacterium]
MNEKFATTFGGSGYAPNTEQYRDGVRLGRFLAERGYTVKCGGYYGLMEAVAEGVRDVSGRVLGITNATFDPKAANRHITEERKQPDLFDRMRELIADSELIVAQEGSLGTMAEVFTAWCLAYTHSLRHKMRLYLVGRSWSSIITSLQNLPITEADRMIPEVFEDMEMFVRSFPQDTSSSNS